MPMGLICWLTFPGLPPNIRTTEALSLSTAGSEISCVAMMV